MEVPNFGALGKGYSVLAAPPTVDFSSKTVTFNLRRAKKVAATRALCPAPTKITSVANLLIAGFQFIGLFLPCQGLRHAGWVKLNLRPQPPGGGRGATLAEGENFFTNSKMAAYIPVEE